MMAEIDWGLARGKRLLLFWLIAFLFFLPERLDVAIGKDFLVLGYQGGAKQQGGGYDDAVRRILVQWRLKLYRFKRDGVVYRHEAEKGQRLNVTQPLSNVKAQAQPAPTDE
jgi:hypothetical protein